MTITSNEAKFYEARIVAPRIQGLGNHPWGWVALGDLTEVLNQTANTIWFQYCHEARAATLDDNWNGKSWKFAAPEEDAHVIKDVWDMKTGNLTSISDGTVERILVPAGWYKTRNKVAELLDTALRSIFRFHSNNPSLSIYSYSDCEVIAEHGRQSVQEAIAAIGTVSQLEWTLSRIVSSPIGLAMTRHDDESKNLIYLAFKNESEHAYMTVRLQIRQKLGEIKLESMSVCDF
ncbi:MAG: hypothetical protein P4L53_04535 [Candidatus Obscuribacterales bacterium]|nr:hypothetical protein [Candidatus Obscuribacterales bacterium]